MFQIVLAIAQVSGIAGAPDSITTQASQCAALYDFVGSGARSNEEQKLYSRKNDLALDVVMAKNVPIAQFKEIADTYFSRISDALKKKDEPSVQFLKTEMLRCDEFIEGQTRARHEVHTPDVAPAKSSYMQTSGGGFMMNFGKEIVGASYGAQFSLTKELPNGGFVTATLDNPENPAAPFVVSQEVSANAKTFLIKSPKFMSAKNSTIYSMRVELYADKTRSKLLDTIQQGVLLSLPKELVPRAGIKLNDG